MNIKHIAIIMDGNGRWAEKNGLKRSAGHKKGAQIVRDITIFCARHNISALSLYAFSTENWRRPKTEVNFLMKLLEEYLKNEEETYIKNNLRFILIGDRSAFSPKLQSLISNLESKTKNNTGMTQALALNYGSHNEISRSIQNALSNQELKPSLKAEMIQNIIEKNLDTNTLPPLDMMIRTGGEKRLSNFLLWQSAYAELFFTDTLFPDFTEQEMQSMMEEFKSRHRKFGGL